MAFCPKCHKNNVNANERDVIQATTLKMQAYSMKIDLLSNASVIQRSAQFVENHGSDTRSLDNTNQIRHLTNIRNL